MNKPNMVFIMVDQLHFNALSAYGNPHVKTPNLDRLAREGYSFMKMHTIMPQCSPARASWMTGRTSKEHGLIVNGFRMDPNVPDIAQWLRRHSDYETVYTGKWHVNGRNNADSFEKVLIHECEPFGELQDPAVGTSAVAYLNQGQQRRRPFFMCVSFLNPHDCCYTAGAHGGQGKFGLAEELQSELPPLPENFPKDGTIRPWGNTGRWSELDWRYYCYSYYRQTEMVDAEIGLVMDAIRTSSYADDTLVIFSSDHGDGLAFHGNVSKGFLDDEAWRVPAIVWGKGIAQNVRDQDHLASALDIPATVADYAGVPPLPKTAFGMSWKPLLEDKEVSWRDYVVGETSIPYLGVSFRDRQGTKTIFYDDGRTDLFDLEKDPLEMNNLSTHPEAAPLLARHRGYFADYLKKIELFRPAEGSLPSRLKKYTGYLDWYPQVKKELGI